MATWLEKNDEFIRKRIEEEPAVADKWEALRQIAQEREWKLDDIDEYYIPPGSLDEPERKVWQCMARANDENTPLWGEDYIAEYPGNRGERVEKQLSQAWGDLVKRAYKIKQQQQQKAAEEMQPEPEPPPDEAEVAAKGEDLSGKQLIFVEMLLEQWKHYCEKKLPMTDLAAAESVDGTDFYTSSRSQATAYNKWKNQNIPNDLRPPKPTRGGKRSPK